MEFLIEVDIFFNISPWAGNLLLERYHKLIVLANRFFFFLKIRII